MAGYKIEPKRSAAKEIDRVKNQKDRRRIVARIVARIARLADDSRPPGC